MDRFNSPFINEDFLSGFLQRIEMVFLPISITHLEQIDGVKLLPEWIAAINTSMLKSEFTRAHADILQKIRNERGILYGLFFQTSNWQEPFAPEQLAAIKKSCGNFVRLFKEYRLVEQRMALMKCRELIRENKEWTKELGDFFIFNDSFIGEFLKQTFEVLERFSSN
jgi:hypothetical protein